jgi:hypothetical protein
MLEIEGKRIYHLEGAGRSVSGSFEAGCGKWRG